MKKNSTQLNKNLSNSFTKTLLPVFLLSLFGGIAKAQSPYCTPVYSGQSGNCTTYGMSVNAVEIKLGSTTLFNRAHTTTNSGCKSSSGQYTLLSSSPMFTLKAGKTYSFGFTTGPTYPVNMMIWIDLNGDNDFLDAGEWMSPPNCVYSVGNVPNGSSTLTYFNVTIPSSVTVGTTRMRIRSEYYFSTCPTTNSGSCDDLSYGEAEDYTINLDADANDVGISALISPTYVCGATADPFIVQIKNSGKNSITSSIPVTMQLSGVTTGTFTKSYTRTLAIGGTDTIHMGTLNTAALKGALTMKSFTGYSLDSAHSNDTNLTNISFYGAQTPLSGSYSVGPTGTFSSIKMASDSLKLKGFNGSVVLELQSTYASSVESFPITIPIFTTNICGTANSNPQLTIRPASGATNLVISGNSATALFILDNAYRVTFDGRPGGTGTSKELSFSNTSGSGTVFTLQNDAIRNTIKYCNIRSSNTNPASGAIFLGTSNKFFGNDSNVISNNLITRSSATSFLYSAITSSPTSNLLIQTDNITITDNEIHSFYNYGINVVNSLGNGEKWTITNNSFYDSATTAGTTSTNWVAINFLPGTTSLSIANIISNNYIGGTLANCGGSPLVNSSSSATMAGIRISCNPGTPTLVQNNVIQNISFTSTTNSAQFMGINPQGGSLILGGAAGKGNTIGHASTANSISSLGNNAMIGISSSAFHDMVMSYNTIANISQNNTSTSGAIRGIVNTGGASVYITNNIIRNFVTNSANAGSTTSAVLIGILMQSSSNNQFITDNIVGGSISEALSSTTTTGQTRVIGIMNIAGITQIKGNKINGLLSSSPSTSNTSSAAIIGIYHQGTNGCVYNGNEIRNLISTAAASTQIEGMYIASGATDITNNIISDLTTASTSTAANQTSCIVGISYNTGLPATINNNTIENFSATANAGTYILGINIQSTLTYMKNNKIRNFSSNSSTTALTPASITGIYVLSASANKNITGNSIYNFYNYNTSAAATILGIYFTTATTFGNYSIVNNNFIHSFGLATSAAGNMTGIYNYGGTATYQNNMIRLGVDSIGNAISGPYTYKGIFQNTIYSNNYYNNSIYLAGISGGTTNSACIELTGTISSPTETVNIKNNIFYNNILNTSTGYNAGISITTNNGRIFSNHNIIYTPNTMGVAGLISTTPYTNLTGASSWNSATLLDGQSGSSNPNYLTPNGTSSTVDLHLSSGNPAESAGDPTVTSVLDDFDNQVRSGLTPNDIGADAGTFTKSGDKFPPIINLNPLTNTSSTSDRTFTVNIIDNGLGMPKTTANAPRVYYKKGSGTVYSGAGSLTSGNQQNGVWTFTINATTLGGVSNADIISYYILAQDSAGNVVSNAMYAIASSVSSVSTDPTTPNTYMIVPSLSTSIDVGSGQTYTTLTETGAAGLFNAINNSGLQGNTVINITSDMTETGAVALNQWIETGGSGYTLTIRPSAASRRAVTGSGTGGMIRLNGADRVKITGMPTGGSSTDTFLFIKTTSTSDPVITLLNDAVNNTIENCVVEGSTTSAILLSATGMVTGNDNNTFIRSYIRAINGSGMTNGIQSLGQLPTAVLPELMNDNITIRECRIYNFTSFGITVAANSGGNNWRILNNHFYRTPSNPATSAQTAINFVPGIISNNDTISGNFIGGMEPYCGGSAFNNSAMSAFNGILLSAGTQDGVQVQGNTIQNFLFSGTGTLTILFTGININGGVVDVGGTTGNNIGDAATSNSIQTNGNAGLIGINSTTSFKLTVNNNIISNLTATGGTVYTSTAVRGIMISTTTYELNVRNNTVQNFNATSSNSGSSTSAAVVGIGVSSGGSVQNILNNTVKNLKNLRNVGNHCMVGLYTLAGLNKTKGNIISGLVSSTANPNSVSTASGIIGLLMNGNLGNSECSDNIISDLQYVSSTPATVQMMGLYISSGSGLKIHNNTISSLNSMTTSTGTQYSAGIIGLCYSGGGTFISFTGNTIHSLNHTNTATANAVNVIGLVSLAASSNTPYLVSRNNIHSLKLSTSGAGTMIGILNYGYSGTYENNMIRIGIDSAGNAFSGPYNVYGIQQLITNSTSAYYYHNSVYLGGSPGSGASVTSAFSLPVAFSATTTRVVIKNNIFHNAVSNTGSASGKNFAMQLQSTSLIFSNNNILYANGTGGITGNIISTATDYTNLSGAASWQSATGFDLNSGSGDPGFVNPTGNALAVNLHLSGTNTAEGNGAMDVPTTDDFDGNIRSGRTPVDIGAHSGNFSLSSDIIAPVITFNLLNNASTTSGSRTVSNVSITDNAGIPMSGTNIPRIYFSKNGSTWYSSAATALTGSNKNAVATFAIDYSTMGGVATGDTIRYYIIAQDNAGNLRSNGLYAVASDVNTITTHPAIPLTYKLVGALAAGSKLRVGTGKTYPTLTGAGGLFEYLNTVSLGGDVTAVISSNTDEPGTFGLNQLGDNGGGTYTLTIRPDSLTNTERLISGNVGSMIRLDGADRVKFSGIPDFNGGGTDRKLRFRNTNTAGQVFLFINEATDNRLNNLNIESGNSSITSGVIQFSTSTKMLGNSRDTVSNCLIEHNRTGVFPLGVPAVDIYSLGDVGKENTANVIMGNEITNFTQYGIWIANVGNGNNWNISGNSFYRSLSIPAFALQYSIFMDVQYQSGGHLISGNYIGGSAKNCGGAPWVNNANVDFRAISFTSGSLFMPSTISNNVIQNIRRTNIGTGATFFGIISQNSVSVNILNNLIGHPTDINSIVLSGGAQHSILTHQSNGNCNIIGNTIQGINCPMQGVAENIVCIFPTNGLCTIRKNLVGSTTVANSIQNSGTGSIIGIQAQMTSLNAPTVLIDSNVVANMTSYGVESGISFRGIVFGNSGTSIPTITNNKVFNCSVNCSNITSVFATNTIVAATGIGIYAIVLGGRVANNTVYNIRANNTGAAPTIVTGLFVNFANNTIFSNNRVYDIINLSTNTNINAPAVACGIMIATAQNSITLQNNQISLGTGQTNSPMYIGIWQSTSGNFTINSFFNSVYIGGTATSGIHSSFGYLRGNNYVTSSYTSIVNAKSNILMNDRKGGTGKHYAIGNQNVITTFQTGWQNNASNYNLLSNSSAYPVALWNITDYNFSDWKANSRSDLNSPYIPSGTSGGEINPDMFVNRAIGDLNLDPSKSGTAEVAYKGMSLTGIAKDFVYITRNSTTPTIGSFEAFGKDAGVSAIVSPTNTTCAASNTQVTVSIKNYGFLSQSNISVTLKVTGSATVTSTQNFAGPLAAGATASYTFPDNINTLAGGTYTIKAYTNLTGEEQRGNDTSMSTITIVPKPTPVASGTNPACEKSTATYSTTLKTGMSYSWSVTGGTIQSGQNTNSISVKWGTVGTASVSVTETITALSCNGSNTLNVTLNPLPKANFTYTDTCGGNFVNFTSASTVSGGTITANSWKFGDATSGTGNTTTHKYTTTSASYSVRIISTSNSGCTDSADKSIFILKTLSAGVIGASQTICYNTTPALITTTTAPSGSISPYTNQWQVSTDNVNFTNISGATGQDYQPGTLTTTTYYRRSTTTAACGPAVSNTVTITVGTLLNPGVIGTAQTICFNGTGSALGFSTTPTGAVGGYTYQWQQSSDSATWSNISGQTSSSFTPTNVTSVTYYRNLVFSGSCPSAGTNGVKIKLYSPITGGSIASGQTICAGTAPAAFTQTAAATGGPGTYTFQWQSSTDSSTWTNISGATSSTYSSGTLSTLTYFQRLAGSTGCPSGTSNAIKVRTNAKPTVSYTASNHCFNDPMPVTNSSTISSGSLTYLWKFGDGTGSTSSVPTKTYTSSGTYTVTLTATSNQGCKDSAIKSVIVATTPSPSFTFSLKCQGDSVIFVDNTVYACGSGSGLQFHWNFGDATTSNVQHARHHYSSAGTYNVKFRISLSGGFKDSITKVVVFNIRSTPNFSATNECFPAATTFTNTSTGFASLAWSFGDASTSTTTNTSFTKTYATAGTYSAKLVSTSTFGCKDSLIKTVNVFSKPKATFSVSNNCLGVSTSFNNSSSGASVYQWTFGDANTSTATNPTNTYATAGTYTVKLKITSTNGCLDSTTNTVTIHPKPVADFSAANVCNGFTSTFTNNSTGASTYSWDFGNGNTSTTASPTYTYPTAGTYNVTLTATTSNGCTHAVTKSYTVNVSPKANFSGSNVCLGSSITFSNSSTGAATNSWNFGDATTSTAAAPTKTYATSGNFTVKLVVTNTFGCKDSTTKSVTIFAKPVPAFTANNQCLGTAVSFTNQSTGATSTIWVFGDGKSSAANSPNYTYATAGTYTVKLITTSVNGCKDSLSKTVTVYARPVVSFTASPDPICRGGLMNFTNTTTNGSTYQWTFGNGNTSTATSPTNIYNTEGNYNVKLVANSVNACKDSANKTVTVWPRPKASFNVNNGCTSDNLGFATNSVGAVGHEWTFGDGNSSTVANPAKGYANAGTYNIQLIVTSINGCKDTSRSTVTVHPRASVSFTNPSNFCLGLSTTFTNTTTLSAGTMTHQWSFGDGNTSSNTSPTNTYKAGGNYTVTLTTTTDKGCQNRNTSSILVYGKPAANFNAGNACAGATVTFNNTTIGGTTYAWDFGNSATSTLTSPTQSYTNAGTYSVKLTATNANNCTDAVTKQIIIYANPVANFTASDRCIGTAIAFTNTSGGASDVSWQFGDGSSSNSFNPSYSYTSPGSYNVTLNIKSVYGCQATVSKSVTVFAAPKAAFSINDNGQCINGNNFIYTDNSTIASGTYNRAWTLGDGSTSTATNATRTYASAGNYTVRLVITSNNGCKDSTNNPVMVYPKPVANFNINNSSQCINSNLFAFTDASTISDGSITRVWNLGDGSSQGGISILKQYSATGTYTVTLGVTSDFGCTDVISKTVTVNSSPAAAFTINNETQCLNSNNFGFTNTSPGASGFTNTWRFGDGTNVSTINASRTYAAAGNYVVTLRLSNASGCRDSSQYTVKVLPNPAAIIVSGPNTALNGSTKIYSVTATPGSTYNWVATNGVVLSNGASMIQVKWNTTGIAGTVTVTETGANGCQGTPANYNVALSTTGINTINRNAFAASLYPNPNKDNFTVEVSTGDMVTMNVYDQLGREILSGYRFSSRITISDHNLPAGIYSAKLVTDKGLTTILRFEVKN